MPDVIGLDHIYITVRDMARSTPFYECAMAILGFRRNTFAINGEPQIQYYNRHFGYVLRLEVTNYRQERRDRHDRWDDTQSATK